MVIFDHLWDSIFGYSNMPAEQIGDSIKINDLWNMVVYKPELLYWNRLAAMITDNKTSNNYFYPLKSMMHSNKHSILRNNSSNNSDKELFNILQYCMQYSAYAYFYEIFGVPKDITIVDSYFPSMFTNNEEYNAGYYIAIDERDKNNLKLLLCIRGSETFGDAITDMDCTPDNILIIDNNKYYVHRGIWEATIKLHNKIIDKIIRTYKNLEKSNNGNYKIIITGHSLGAGISSMLGILWYYYGNNLLKTNSKNLIHSTSKQCKKLLNKFYCYSFASPCIIDKNGRNLSLNIKDNNNNYIITTVANTIDIVTRLSAPSIVELNDRIDIIKNYGRKNTWKIIDKIYTMRSNYKTHKEFDTWLKSDVAKKEREFISHLRNPINSKYNKKQLSNTYKYGNLKKLYPCGLIIYGVPGYIKNEYQETKETQFKISMSTPKGSTTISASNGMSYDSTRLPINMSPKSESGSKLSVINVADTYIKLNRMIVFSNMWPVILQWFMKIFCDIFGGFVDYFRRDGMILYKIDGINGIPDNIFQSMVYNTGEALQAHCPGRYLYLFNKDIIDVLQLSCQWWTYYLPTKDCSVIQTFLRLCVAGVILIISKIFNFFFNLIKIIF